MKTLSNLSATATAAPDVQTQASSIKPPKAARAGKGISNTQSQAGFWRRLRHAKDSITAESSAGGSVTLPVSELWKLVETHDALLVKPKIVVKSKTT